MALRLRTVSGIMVDPTGAPIANAMINFQLNLPLGYTATHIIVDKLITTRTDENGAINVDLWTEQDSLVAIKYKVTFPSESDGNPDSKHTAEFDFPYGDGSEVDLPSLINANAIVASED